MRETMTILVKAFQERTYGTGVEVEIKESIKTNGVVREGICIKEPGQRVAPVMYVDNILEDMANGNIDSEEAAERLEDYYHSIKNDIPYGVNEKLTRDYILDNVREILVNAEKNKADKKDRPIKDFLDLFVEYEIEFGGCGTTRVLNSMLDAFGITEEELKARAHLNSIGCWKLTSMRETISQIYMENCGMPREIAEAMITMQDDNMYVLSNESKFHGAAALFHIEMLLQVPGNDDLFILPSSIHEVLVVPDNGEMTVADLRSMVYEVNCAEVAPEEVLSHSVYKFNRETGRIDIA